MLFCCLPISLLPCLLGLPPALSLRPGLSRLHPKQCIRVAKWELDSGVHSAGCSFSCPHMTMNTQRRGLFLIQQRAIEASHSPRILPSLFHLKSSPTGFSLPDRYTLIIEKNPNSLERKSLCPDEWKLILPLLNLLIYLSERVDVCKSH